VAAPPHRPPVATTPGPYRAEDLAYLVELADTLVTMARRLGESGTEPRRRRSVLLRRQLLLIAFGGVHAALLFQGSDDPTALIATDTLSRNLGHGCATWNDVTGTTYDLPDVKPSHGFYQERRTSGSWQDTVNPYLETGEAMILGRPSTGIHPGVLTYWTNATTPRPAAGTPCTTGPAPTCRPTARKRLWHGP
jgi:hypothetical protein